jgi:hypothetical protein
VTIFYTELEKIARSRNHVILNGKYESLKSVFKIKCLKHDVSFNINAKQYKAAECGAPCCIKEQKVLPPLVLETIETGDLNVEKYTFQQNQRLEGYQEFQKRLALKNHQVIDGVYENNLSKLTIFCQEHNQTFITTPDNHEKSFYGLPCCAKVGQSQTVLNKNVEELKNLSVFRKHEISDQSLKDYNSQDTKLTFKCLIHNQIFVTTRRLYKKSKYGLTCCKEYPKILPQPP